MADEHAYELQCPGGERPAPLPRVALYLALGLIAFGVLLRLRLYLFNDALWLDEASMALDLMRFHTLDIQMHHGHTQICPLLFLLLTNASMLLFGAGEHALRLPALLAGVAAFVPFYFLARRSLGPGAFVVAVGLMAVAPKAAGYAAMLKPYSLDVAVSATLAYLGVLTVHRRLDVKWTLLLGAAGAGAVWSSLPSIFLLAGFGTVFWTAAMLRRQWRRALSLTAVGLVWVISAGAYYALFLHGPSESPALNNYWESGYVPPPTSLHVLSWFRQTFSSALHDVGGYRVTLLAAIAFGMGVAAQARRCRDMAFALTAPFAVTLVASAVRVYPFSGRLLLFLLPLLCVLVAAGVERAWTGTRGKWRVLAALLIAMLLAYPAQRAVAIFVSPEPREEIRPVLAYIAEHRRAGDVLYAYRPAYLAFRYYDERYGLKDAGMIRGGRPPKDRAGYEKEFRQLEGRGRTWLLFSHIKEPQRDAILRYLGTIGTRLDDVQATGASAYLYDMDTARGSP